MSGLFFFFLSLKPCETVIRRPLWGFKHHGCCHFMLLGCNESLRFIWEFLFKLTQILPPLDGSTRLKNKGLDHTPAYTAVYACVFMSVCTRVYVCALLSVSFYARQDRPVSHQSTDQHPSLLLCCSFHRLTSLFAHNLCEIALGPLPFWPKTINQSSSVD